MDMEYVKAFEGISSVYLSRGSSVDGPQSDNCRAARCTSRTIGRESAQAGTEAKVCAETRRPRPWRRLVPVRRMAEPDQVLVGQPTSHDAVDRKAEAVGVVHVDPVIVAERLFVQIPEQVERLDADIRAAQPALQQRPVVLQAVRVDFAVHVGDRMVNDLVRVFTGESIVGQQRVTVERRTGFDVLVHFGRWLESE